MTDTQQSKTPEQVREEVRDRYAQAATAVVRGTSNTELNDALQVIDDSCGTGSCCSGDAVVDQSIGAVL